MATIIKSIGSAVGRDYATIQAFIDSIPTDVVASGNSYIGELYNDSEFTAGFNLTGKTTDSTHFITIRCAAGQSFSTHANRANNPLWYNQAYGVAIKSASTSAIINSSVNYTVVDGLQVWGTASNGYPIAISGTGAVVKNCILMGSPSNSSNARNVVIGLNATIANCLVVSNLLGAGNGITLGGSGGTTTMVNCTVVKPTSKVDSAYAPRSIELNYGTVVVKNSALFGFTNRSISPNSFSASDYNASDWTETPSGTAATHSMTGLVAANQFVSAENDFRLKAGSDLIDKGVNLSASYSYLATDVFGSVRQAPWDIGMYEIPVPATSISITGPSLGKVNTASTNFTVSGNGSISSANTVTLSDGGKGGTFTPATVQLVGSNPSATFTYTPAVTGTITISLTNSGGLTNPAAVTYSSVNPATKVTLTGPTSARAGVQSTNFTVTMDGYVSSIVKVVPNDGGDGGSFNPPFISLDATTLTGTFTYVGATAGTKTISITNDGSLSNVGTVTITEKSPVVPVPTPSTGTLLVKSIGTGKDFANLKAFTDFANAFDLTANATSLMGEVYENQAVATTSSLSPKNPTADYKLILQPVPGTSVNYLDKGDPLDYGTEGIELTFTSSSPFQITRGAILQDFRCNVQGASGLILQAGTSTEIPMVKRCRFKSVSSANTIQAGTYGTPSTVQDCLFIQDDPAAGAAVSASYNITLSRNTFVRRGNASLTAINLPSTGTHVLNDNALINYGVTPVNNIAQVTGANVFNNIVDAVWTTPKAGFTAVTGTPLVRNTTNDFRPADNGGLVGQASASAIDSLDIYSSSRGGSPDVGCAQGSIVDVLPKVTITTQTVNGQTITLSGTTQYIPTSGTAVLLPDATNPNGAVQQGPINVTLGSGTFNVVFNNVPAGNYQIPKLILSNDKGYNRSQTGGSAVVIIPISAAIVAGESSATVGNAPSVTVTSTTFDNTVLNVIGSVDNQGDSTCTIKMYLDPNPSGTTIGPINANIIGKQFAIQYSGINGNFKIRLVATANGQTTTVTGDVTKVISYTASFLLPAPGA